MKKSQQKNQRYGCLDVLQQLPVMKLPFKNLPGTIRNHLPEWILNSVFEHSALL
jgi:hypothetical protein